MGAKPLPDDAARLLARAAEKIDAHTLLAVYDVDDQELPTDTAVAAAFREACCAQVEQWAEVGEENDIDGLAGTDLSVDGYSGPRAPGLAPRARTILVNAGLAGGSVTTGVRW